MLYDTGKFKKRMQSLKAYREQNPDKGYWDWKIQSSQLGGNIEGEASLETIKQREWLRDWLSSRVDQMAENIDAYSNQKYYGSLTDRAHVAPFFFQDKRKNASKVIKEQLDFIDNVPVYDHREPWMRNDKSIPYIKEFARRLASDPHVRGSYVHEYGKQPAIHVSPITPIHDSVIVHELSHGTQDKYKIQTSKINDILQKYNNENSSLDKYYDDPNEIYSRLNQFRYENYLNPQDVISKEQIKQWKDSSIDKHDLIDRYSIDTLFELFNNVASTGNKKDNNIISAADGGKIKYENGDKVDNGYMAWRNSLPDNLRYTDDSEYDMRAAYESGAEPRLEDDGLWHLPSRDQRTGRILKKPWHETYGEALKTDAGLGYKAYLIGNETYTWNDKDGIFVPWQSDEVPSYADGGEDDGSLSPFTWNGPTYTQLIEQMNQDDPTLYPRITEVSTPPVQDYVAYQDNARVGEATQLPVVRQQNVHADDAISFGPLGFAPGIGDVEEAMNVYDDIREGNYSSAALGAALWLLPGNWGKILKNNITTPSRLRRLRDQYYDMAKKETEASRDALLRMKNMSDKRLEKLLQNAGVTDPSNDPRVFYGVSMRRMYAKDLRDKYDYARFAQIHEMPLFSDRGSTNRNTRRAWENYRSQQNGGRPASGPDYNSTLYKSFEETTPEDQKELLRQLWADDPQYMSFTIDKDLPFWEQSTVDQWIDKQRTSIRGVYTDIPNAGIDELDPMFTLTKSFNPGGDRLKTSGGLYVSNSNDIADRFSRSLSDKPGTAAYAILQAPDIDRTLPIREQLAQVRRRIIPYDVERANGMSNSWLLSKGYIGKQAQYSTGTGQRLPAYETSYFANRPFTKVADVLDYGTSAETKNIRGRWGAGAGGAGLTDRLYSPRSLGYSYGDFLNLYRLAYHDRLSTMPTSGISIEDDALRNKVKNQIIGHDADEAYSRYTDMANKADRKADRLENIRDASLYSIPVGGAAGFIYLLHDRIESNKEQEEIRAYDEAARKWYDDMRKNKDWTPLNIYTPPTPAYDNGGIHNGGTHNKKIISKRKRSK